MAKTLLIEWDKEESLDLPEQRYLFKVVEAESGESGKGDPQIILTLMVVSPKKYKGRKQKVWLTINSRSLRFVRIACEAILGKEMPRKASKLRLDSFIGKLVFAEVERNGEYSNVTNWERYGEGEDSDADDEVEDSDLDFDDGDDDEAEDDADDDGDLDFDDDDEDDEPQPRRRRR